MARSERDEREIPAHPYRDTAIVYGIMAVILVVLAGVTGGGLVRATGAAIVFWLVAFGWSSWKFRRRIRERDLAEAAAQAGVEAAASEGAARPAGGQTTGTANGAAHGNGNGRGAGTGE